SEFKQALELWNVIEYKKGVAFAKNDLGAEIYLPEERWDLAQQNLEESAAIYEEIGAKTYLPNNYEKLFEVYLAIRQLEQALTTAEKTLLSAREIKNRGQIIKAYRLVGEAHLRLGYKVLAHAHAQMSLSLAEAAPPLVKQIKATQELLQRTDPSSV